jgi:FkbM family methyltransferase
MPSHGSHHVLTRLAHRVKSIQRAFAAGRHVRESSAFVRREARKAPETITYRLRSTGAPVRIRHDRNDAWTLYELFGLRAYEIPPAVHDVLATVEHPNVLDLGGNIGLFAQFVFGEIPGARVTSVEADPDNAEVLHAVRNASDRDAAWRIIEAAAGNASGRAAFRADASPQSRLVDSLSNDEAVVEVDVIDALPLLEAADFAKVDIEGGEWALLADPRLLTTRARVLALEYHEHMCPTANAADAAVTLVERAGFTIVDGPRSDPRHCGPDVGMLWAIRDIA